MKNFIMMIIGVISVVCAYVITYEMLEDLNFTYLNGSFMAQVVTILIISVVLDAFMAWVINTEIEDLLR